MTPILWLVAALLLAGIIVFVSSLATRRRLPPVELADGRPLPKTALQTRATWTLIVVAALTAAAAACVVYFSPQVWWDNDAVRLTVTFLLLAALCVYLVFTIGVRSLEQRGEGADASTFLVNDITLTDERLYTEPVLLHAEAALSPDMFMLEYTCTNTIWEEYLDERGLILPDIDSLP